MSTLIIGAHPDDEALAVGGTVLRLTQEKNEDVFALIVTDGSSTQYPGDEEKRNQKNAELSVCCKILGISDFVHGQFPDMQLETVPHTEITGFISKHIQKWKPDTVYTHFPDCNRDHERVYESTVIAARPCASSVKRLLLFPTPSTTEWQLPGKSHTFSPNSWVNIESTIDKKLEALTCYKTELREPPNPRSLESIRAFAQGAGAPAGMRFAEEFMSVRDLW